LDQHLNIGGIVHNDDDGNSSDEDDSDSDDEDLNEEFVMPTLGKGIRQKTIAPENPFG